MNLNERDREARRLQLNIESCIIDAQNLRLTRDLKGKTITAIRFTGTDILITLDGTSQVILSAVEWYGKPSLDFSVNTDTDSI